MEDEKGSPEDEERSSAEGEGNSRSSAEGEDGSSAQDENGSSPKDGDGSSAQDENGSSTEDEKGFLQSDKFRNLTAAAAAAIALIALFVSMASCHNSSEALRLQRENAEKQGDFLVLRGPYVEIWDGAQKQIYQQSPLDTGPLVYIPADVWRNSGKRKLTVLALNDGQQDAHLGPMFFATKVIEGDYLMNDDRASLNAQCGEDVEAVGPCPTTLAPHDFVFVTVSIPDSYVEELDPALREQGIIFCVQAAARPACSRTAIVVPPEAMP